MTSYYGVIGEFVRYGIVGGLSFVADMVVLVLFRETILKDLVFGLYISAMLGFIAGLLVNYVLSIKFVFNAAKRGKGRGLGPFMLFVLICVLGLVFTEIGMWLGVEVFCLHYVVVKAFVAGAVLFWNYLAKKILIFRA